MSLISSAVEPLIRAISKQGVPISTPLRTFIEKGLPRTDIPGLENLSKESPEIFQRYVGHLDNYATRGEQGGLIEARHIADQANTRFNNQQIKTQELAAENARYNQQVDETKGYDISKDTEDYLSDMQPEELSIGREWLREGGGLEQAADENFLVAGTSRTVTDSTGNTIKVKKGDRLTRDMLSANDQEYYDSLMASGWAQSSEDKITWGVPKPKIKGPGGKMQTVYASDELSKMASLEGQVPGWSNQRNKALTFHHRQMKKIAGKIWGRARQLYKSGEATLDDLVNLHAMSNRMGQPSGSRRSAGLLLEEAGHNYAHKQVLQPKGIEPTTTPASTKPLRKTKKGGYQKPSGSTYEPEVWNAAVKAANELDVPLTRFDVEYIQGWSRTTKGGLDISNAVAKWKVLRKNETLYRQLGPDGLSEMDRYLKDIDSMGIADLQRFLKDSIENIATPMTEEQVLMQEVLDLFTASELMKLQTNKDWNSLKNLRRALKDKKAAIKEVKIDEQIRQMGG